MKLVEKVTFLEKCKKRPGLFKSLCTTGFTVGIVVSSIGCFGESDNRVGTEYGTPRTYLFFQTTVVVVAAVSSGDGCGDARVLLVCPAENGKLITVRQRGLPSAAC